ncbi:MAG: type II secretion system F family protein [Planctomycetes bacterium]|nr:type II secretion system F family protein [Planctomycetota bacterium]
MSTQPPPAKDPLDAYAPLEKSKSGGRIGLQALSRFCHNIGTGLHAGVDVRRVFETEANRGSTAHRNKILEIREHVSRGTSVSEALKASNGYFPSLLCEMVEVGERTGRLEQIFLRLGEYYEQLLKLRRTFIMGIAWPMLELIGAILVIGLFILIIGMVSDGEPAMTFFGLYGARGAIIYFTIVGLIAGAFTMTIVAAMRGWISLEPFLRFLMNVPFLGTGLQNVALSRLTWSLAMATDSDLSAKRAVELAVKTTQSTYYMRFIDGMKNVIGRGRTMHDAFATTGVYPDDFLASLETGEIAGSISETMLILSREYEDRTKTFFRVMTGIAGALVFLTVAGIIITMIFKMAMQYIGILNDAANI